MNNIAFLMWLHTYTIYACLHVCVCVCVRVRMCVRRTCVSLLQLFSLQSLLLVEKPELSQVRHTGPWVVSHTHTAAAQENRGMAVEESRTEREREREVKSYRAAWLIPATAALVLQGTQPGSAALKRLIPLMCAAMRR